jgi:hypothetical protein
MERKRLQKPASLLLAVRPWKSKALTFSDFILDSASRCLSLKVPIWTLLCCIYHHCSLLTCTAPGAKITDDYWCLPWSLLAALYTLPLLRRKSIYDLPLANRCSKEVAPSVCIYMWRTAAFRTRLLPSCNPDTFTGHSWWSTQSTAISCAHLGVHIAQSGMRLLVDIRISGLLSRPPRHQFNREPTAAVTIWTEKLTETITYSSHRLGLSENPTMLIPTWE